VNFSNIFFEDSIDFENTTFSKGTDFSGSTFSGSASFNGATLNWIADFSGATFGGSANFSRAMFRMEADFHVATFSGLVSFSETTINGFAKFGGALFNGFAQFSGATFGWLSEFSRATFVHVDFGGATFSTDAFFRGTTFKGSAIFDEATFARDAFFNGTTFRRSASFGGAKFAGDVLTFRDSVFNLPESQEEACRRAKNVLAKAGNRDEEEYHFYREMEAKRIQKGFRGNSGLSFVDLVDCLKTDTWSFWRYFFHDAIEWIFVQMMFGYGVHFERLIASWAIIVVISGVSNAFDCLKVSFATAIAPGYIAIIINPGNSTGGYRITSGYYQAAAMVETLFGTFLWSGFIATFAKKYMR
jgi:hypothetical protein